MPYNSPEVNEFLSRHGEHPQYKAIVKQRALYYKALPPRERDKTYFNRYVSIGTAALEYGVNGNTQKGRVSWVGLMVEVQAYEEAVLSEE